METVSLASMAGVDLFGMLASRFFLAVFFFSFADMLFGGFFFCCSFRFSCL